MWEKKKGMKGSFFFFLSRWCQDPFWYALLTSRGLFHDRSFVARKERQ